MIVGSTLFKVKLGDITLEQVDVIVNAANSGLLGGGGVDGAIHRRGGPTILEECRRIRERHGKCPPGEAVATGAGRLLAKYVIHTVGPIWNGGSQGEEDVLRAAYLNSLKLAEHLDISSIAFPSISTGAYRFPIELAARVALASSRAFALGQAQIKEIRFVTFSDADFAVYERIAMEIAGEGC